MASTSRRLFVGGPMHGKVETVNTEENHVMTIDRHGEGFDAEYSQVLYYRKRFRAGDCGLDVFVVGNPPAGNILAALATLAGVDYEHIGE
jgi:hypothetical protein